MKKEVTLFDIVTEIAIAVARVTWGMIRIFIIFIGIVLYRHGR